MSCRLTDVILPWLLKQSSPVDLGSTFKLSTEECVALKASSFLQWDRTGRVTHVWLIALRQLHADASTQHVCVPQWAARNRVHDIPGFLKHANVASSSTLHRLADGSVRLRTAYNIVSPAHLVETIRTSSVKGVDRIMVIQEYPGAYKDLAGFIEKQILWSNGERVWHKDYFSGHGTLDPFSTIVFNATENAVCTLRLVSEAIGCQDEAVEHAVAHLVSCNKLQIVVPGAPFFIRVINTFEADCQKAARPKRQRICGRRGRMQWTKRPKLPSGSCLYGKPRGVRTQTQCRP